MQNNTLGIDEAGRGAWAGPLVAGAVILKEPIDGLSDSKKLSKIQRKKLFCRIRREAVDIGIGWVSAHEIDGIGLTSANALAMKRAAEQVSSKFNKAIIDGNVKYIDGPEFVAVVKADQKYQSVSAASIVAKVARDDYMAAMDKQYQGYEFSNHVGYGVKAHKEALIKHGACKLHRMSYRPVEETNDIYQGTKS